VRSFLRAQRYRSAGWRLAFVRRILIFAPICLLAACTTRYYHYRADYKLKMVQTKPAGEIQKERIQRDSTVYKFTDNAVHAEWAYTGGARFDFVLENLTSETMRIIWQQVRYVDENLDSHRVLHADLISSPQPRKWFDSLIPPHKRTVDFVLPEYLTTISSRSPRRIVREEPLVSLRSHDLESARQEALNFDGSRVSIAMPVNRNGVTVTYGFTFEFTDIKVR
jgi:hypothetical protein